ncbi:MAG: carbohydrate ABC transporter permease [Clostridia bacterium]|nr:carbohydrate ABC transporter permease [Clostridia bacterium]
MNSQPAVKKETKNKIRVEFDRTPLKDRLKAKFGNLAFYTNIVWYIFRFVILLGVSYVVLYPFFTKIAASFMSPEDFIDVTVMLIPKYPSLDQYKAIFLENDYISAFFNTLSLSLISAILQTFVSCLVGYGLAKFKFKGNALVMGAVILTMVVPHGTVYLSMFMQFRYFDLFDFFGLFESFGYTGIIDAIAGNGGVQLTASYWPLVILSATGLAFKNGLYIFMMRQFFRGVPDELEESAYIDGSGTLRTFLQIIIPLSVPMMITIFLFAFSWQWTDDFYTNMFISTNKIKLMPDIVGIPKSLETTYAGQELYYSAINNTCGLMIIMPLVVMYLFCQRYLVQGIERSGIVG